MNEQEEVVGTIIPPRVGLALLMKSCFHEPERYPEQRSYDRLWPIPVVAR